jgi:putative transport protein
MHGGKTMRLRGLSISGATSNPAILAFASRTAPTDRPNVGYAMIFPSMTILKILFVQIAAVLLGG